MKDLFGLEDQPALVVGGGRGIGRATAQLLARAGARVAVADNDRERAEEVAAEVGGCAVGGDVTVEDEARRMVDEAATALGGLTRVANIVGLVNMKPFLESESTHWEAQLRLNLLQQMYVCHAACPHLLAAGGGAIAMVASVSGIYGARNQVAYGIAKAGVMSLARTLSDELAGRGIRVNCVAPDITATPRVMAAVPGSPDEVLAMFDGLAVSEGVPMRGFGRTEEIARPLLFLLSDMSSYMTGQCLVIDGGTSIHFPHTVG